jgi:uncharacterized protein (TIGR04141 family)
MNVTGRTAHVSYINQQTRTRNARRFQQLGWANSRRPEFAQELVTDQGWFALQQPFQPGRRRVYGVIANWRQRSLATALPFFSKVTLRKTVQDLTNRGFRVSFAKILTE